MPDSPWITRQITSPLYRAALSHFYRYLAQFKLSMDRLDESHARDFDEDLVRHNLKRATRKGHLGHINIFLRWLEDQGELPAGTAHRIFPNYHKLNLPRFRGHGETSRLRIAVEGVTDGTKKDAAYG